MKAHSRILRLATVAALAAAAAQAQSKTGSVVLDAMKAELDRSLEKLKAQPVPPYFLSYEITEIQSAGVSASFGAVTSMGENRRRQLDIDLRVGDYTLDNTREIRGDRFSGMGGRFSSVEVPLDNDPDALRAVLWYHTDENFKQAVEQLTKVRTNVKVKVEQEDKSSDFSRETAEKYVERGEPAPVDLAAWKEKVKKYTAPFSKYGNIYSAGANFSASYETRWFVSSEGAQIQTVQPYYRLSINAFTKADDGMELPRYESYFAFTPGGLPDDATVLKDVERMIKDLLALRVAPVVDPYNGPAVLSGRAAGVFFHEVFGHRIEGHRQKREEEGQTFKKKVNEKVLDAAFSVYFDPTVKRAADRDLSGAYRYDNQGVKARRVGIIENGVLKTFLMSRNPIDGFPASNGHGRKQPGLKPVSRQSNLIVEVAKTAVHPDLKKLLIEQVKKENKPYGLYFDDISGGFTITGRMIPNAFNVMPLVVYRIYSDGREELVRGVDIIGTPLTTFSRIIAADNKPGVFNGYCGAESGSVPVAAISPGIFVSQIEAQKKEKSQERPPLLNPPFEAIQ